MVGIGHACVQPWGWLSVCFAGVQVHCYHLSILMPTVRIHKHWSSQHFNTEQHQHNTVKKHQERSVNHLHNCMRGSYMKGQPLFVPERNLLCISCAAISTTRLSACIKTLLWSVHARHFRSTDTTMYHKHGVSLAYCDAIPDKYAACTDNKPSTHAASHSLSQSAHRGKGPGTALLPLRSCRLEHHKYSAHD